MHRLDVRRVHAVSRKGHGRPIPCVSGGGPIDRFARFGPIGGHSMKKVEDYRRHARKRARSSAEQQMLLNMAETSEYLAVDWEALSRGRSGSHLDSGTAAHPAKPSIPIDWLNASNDE
jgi:hypothetical protein